MQPRIVVRLAKACKGFPLHCRAVLVSSRAAAAFTMLVLFLATIRCGRDVAGGYGEGLGLNSTSAQKSTVGDNFGAPLQPSPAHIPVSARPMPSVQHVIIVFQENRSTDNLFHSLPNADVANSGVDSHGQIITLTPVPLNTQYDLAHTHQAFVDAYDNGKMDGADKVQVICSHKTKDCSLPHPQFVYVKPSQVRPYFDLAQQYAFSDRMFETQQGPSFPAHQFIISGSSSPTASSDLFAAENPFRQSGPPLYSSFLHSGCTSSAGVRVDLIDPSGAESKAVYPCFERPTLPDLLDQARLTWRYYSVGDAWNALWNGPAAVRHLRFGPDWNRVVSKNTEILTDIQRERLPNVSWVIPSGQASDHPGNTGEGPSWVAAIVNAVGHSQYWWNTVILITWDDWGGFYDHVPPPMYNSYEYGFRVPLIVVSPYTRQGYVSHFTHDFGSILHFIELTFSLPSLGYADARADDLGDCFDYSQSPRAFRTVLAPLNAQYFLEDRRRPEDPDND